MRIANGARLIAAVPQYAGHEYPREWLVAAERADSDRVSGSDFHRYALVTMTSLDASHWLQGEWFNSERALMAEFYLRCGVMSLDATQLRKLLASNVVVG